MRRIVLGLAVVSAMSVLPAAAHHPHRVVKDYVGSFDPLSPRVCERNAQLGVNVGGACFPVPHAASSRVSITLADAANSQAGFFYRFYDADGRCAVPGEELGECDSAGSGCPSLSSLGIPGNAVGLEVLPSSVVLGPLTCLNNGNPSPGFAVAGQIIVVFRQ